MTPPMTDRREFIPWIVACALLMQNLDSTAVTTAVPQMAHSLGVAPIKLSAAVTSYVLAVAVFLPASGWAADRFGARTIFATAIGLFTLASMACGLAPDLTSLVIARVVQGIGGAMMVPVGRLILVRSVPRERLIQAMARTTTPALVGPALGPLAGGLLTSYASWRWIFFINLPIGIVGIALVLLLVPNIKGERETLGRFDLTGFLISGVALGSFVAGLEGLSRPGGVSGGVILLLLVAAAAAIGYWAHARRCARPVIDLSLFRHASFAAGAGGGSLFRLGAGALPFLMPMLLQVGFGMSPIASGSTTFLTAIGALTSKSFARPLLRKLGFRVVLVGNALASGIVLGSLALIRPTTSHALLVVALFVGGMLRSIQFTSMNSVTYADVAPAEESQANTVANVAQQLSISVGVAVAAIMLQLAQAMRGSSHLTAPDFPPAFLLIGLLTAASAWWFARLDAGAGAAMTGHVRRVSS